MRKGKPRNIEHIVERHRICVLPREPSGEQHAHPGEKMRALDAYLEQVERWVEENTGLLPSHRQRGEFLRGDMIYPELTYRQDLEPSQITVKFTDSQGTERELELEGENAIEIVIYGFP